MATRTTKPFPFTKGGRGCAATHQPPHGDGLPAARGTGAIDPAHRDHALATVAPTSPDPAPHVPGYPQGPLEEDPGQRPKMLRPPSRDRCCPGLGAVQRRPKSLFSSRGGDPCPHRGARHRRGGTGQSHHLPHGSGAADVSSSLGGVRVNREWEEGYCTRAAGVAAAARKSQEVGAAILQA